MKFFTSPPRLQIRTPSPTTIEFTVTNSRPPSLTLSILRPLLTFFRLTSLTMLTLLLLSRLFPPPPPSELGSSSSSSSSSAPASPSTTVIPFLTAILQTFTTLPLLGTKVLPPILALPYYQFYPPVFILLYLSLYRVSTQESLLVMKQLGVQTSTTAGTLWGQQRKTRFIPTGKVGDVLLLEGFWGWQVRYYVAIVVEGEGKLVVVFPVSWRFPSVEIWRARKKMAETKEGYVLRVHMC